VVIEFPLQTMLISFICPPAEYYDPPQFYGCHYYYQKSLLLLKLKTMRTWCEMCCTTCSKNCWEKLKSSKQKLFPTAYAFKMVWQNCHQAVLFFHNSKYYHQGVGSWKYNFSPLFAHKATIWKKLPVS